MFSFLFYLSSVHQLTAQWSSSKENIFILLNQIISLDRFPRGRVGRPKNKSIFMDFSLCCNIAFAKNGFDSLHWKIAAYGCTHFPTLCSPIKILI